MRVGVQLPEVEREVRWEELSSIARAAEEVGFDSVFVGDHLLYRGDGRPERGPLEAWSLLAGLAACTERVQLGPLVCCTAFRLPAVLAKMAATVDDMSGGRLVLGLGSGWNEAEFSAFGAPFDRRVARFEEAFEVIRRLLAGERVEHRGEYVSLDDAVLVPPPRRRVPLMVGSNSDRMLAATLAHVDRWNTWWNGYDNAPERFAALNSTISRAALAAGRDPETLERSACVLVVLDASSLERPVPPGVVPLSGTHEEISAGLLRMHDAGADEVILVVSPINERSVRDLGSVLERLDRR